MPPALQKKALEAEMVPIQPAPIGCLVAILALIAAPLLFLGVTSSSSTIDTGPIYQEFGPAPVEITPAASDADALVIPSTPVP